MLCGAPTRKQPTAISNTKTNPHPDNPEAFVLPLEKIEFEKVNRLVVRTELEKNREVPVQYFSPNETVESEYRRAGSCNRFKPTRTIYAK